MKTDDEVVNSAVADMKENGIYGVVFALNPANGEQTLSVVGPHGGGNASMAQVLITAANAMVTAHRDMRDHPDLPPKHRGTL